MPAPAHDPRPDRKDVAEPLITAVAPGKEQEGRGGGSAITGAQDWPGPAGRAGDPAGQGAGLAAGRALAAIEISVADHPGSLPQVCGLLARREFHVEALLSLPAPGGRRSVWLLVPDDARLEQLVLQVSKLGDVLGVARREGLGPFDALNTERGLSPLSGSHPAGG